MNRHTTMALVLVSLVLTACQSVSPALRTAEQEAPAAPLRGGIIDSHAHAGWPGTDDADQRAQRLAEMDANGVALSVLFITTPDDLEKWAAKAPGRFIAGPMFPCPQLDAERMFCFPETGGWPDPAWLEGELKSGRIGLLGELIFNYAGIAPADLRMDAYWALAAKYDVPVMVHTNGGPGPGLGPRRFAGCCPDYDENLGDPDLMRPVLARYPNLRVSLQHSGFPEPSTPGGKVYLDQTVGLMRDYPNVYADMSVLDSAWEPELHAIGLKRLLDAGLGDRIMFGSDDFPTAPIVARLENFDFLSDAQRRAILHDNAARFFRTRAD